MNSLLHSHAQKTHPSRCFSLFVLCATAQSWFLSSFLIISSKSWVTYSPLFSLYLLNFSGVSSLTPLVHFSPYRLPGLTSMTSMSNCMPMIHGPFPLFQIHRPNLFSRLQAQIAHVSQPLKVDISKWISQMYLKPVMSK